MLKRSRFRKVLNKFLNMKHTDKMDKPEFTQLLIQNTISGVIKYNMENPDKAHELMEGLKEAYEFFTEFEKDKMKFKELLLLMNPTLKEVIKHVCKELLKC